MLNLRKKWAAGMAAMSMAVLMSCGSAVPALAQSNEAAATGKDPVVVEETITNKTEEEKKEETSADRDVSGALTPNGNLTLVDDLDKEASKEMQFMTVTTRDGIYYYIVIDRSGNSENVYFLNAVDTVDLMNLMSDKDKTQLEESKKPETENVITPEEELEEENNAKEDKLDPAPEKEEKVNTALPMFGIFAAIGAVVMGAYYMLKIRPKKKQTHLEEDLEFYDDEEYENEDESEEDVEEDTEVEEK